MKKFLIIFLLFNLMILNAGLLWAKEKSLGLSIDKDTVELSSAITLGLTFNDAQGVPAPQLPELDGFKIQYLGPSTVMSIINGQVSSSITHRYILIPIKPGTFTIGPFSISHKGDDYKSRAQQIKVVSRGQAPQQRTPLTTPQFGLEDETEEQLKERIFLILSTEKTKAYLNERILLKVKLYVSQLAVRDIEYPQLTGEGYLNDAFVKPKQYREELGGMSYDVIEFKTYAYPSREGQITLGPAQLKCNIVAKAKRQRRSFGLGDFFDRDLFDDSFFDDFFSRYQVYPIGLKSVALNLQILPLPEEAKPDDFSGAVGDFRMDIDFGPKQVKVGDPITLKMEISGEGNFNSVNNPILETTEDFKIYQPEVKINEDSKTFEQVIIPQTEAVNQMPAVKFVYFDLDKKEYVTLRQPEVPIAVSPADEKEAKVIDAANIQGINRQPEAKILGRDIVYIKEDLGRLRRRGQYIYNNRWFIGLQFLPLIFFVFLTTFIRRKQRLSSDIRYARFLRAPKVARSGLKKAREFLTDNQPQDFYDTVFKTLQQYLGHRFGKSAAGITAAVVDELIVSESLDKSMGLRLKMCFSDCDMARYSPSAFDQQKMAETLLRLKEVIDYLERKRR